MTDPLANPGDLVPSFLRKEISPVWMLPLALVGLPFLLAAVGRVVGALGAASAGEALVGWAKIYGNLPIFLLGFSPSELENTVFAYVSAGLLYSGGVLLLLSVIRLRGRQT